MPLSKAKEKKGSQDTAADHNEPSLPDHTEAANQPAPGDHGIVYVYSFSLALMSFVIMQPFFNNEKAPFWCLRQFSEGFFVVNVCNF